MVSPAKLSAPLRELHPSAESVFRDAYLIEFLDLPPQHSEADLQRALVEQLKQFLMELGRDFCFIGSQYLLQVGGRDFVLDLLFYNRSLNCLVAFELKAVEFEPEHLGTEIANPGSSIDSAKQHGCNRGYGHRRHSGRPAIVCQRWREGRRA